MIICLSPHCQVTSSPHGKLLIIDEDNCYELDVNEKWTPGFMLALQNGLAVHDIRNQHHAAEKTAILQHLHLLGLLIEQPQEDWNDKIYQKQLGWLAKHSSRPAYSQQQLSESKVAVIGLGGVGSMVVQHLVASGVKNFHLVDGDTVATDNLNRQYLFSRKDIGKAKVDCVREYIQSIEPESQVTIEKHFVTCVSDLEALAFFSPHLVIQCADKPVGKINDIVSRFCFEQQMAFLTAAVGLESGYWGPFIIPGKTICFACYTAFSTENLSEDQLEMMHRGTSIQPYSFGPVNSLVASLCARDATLYLMGMHNIHSAGNRVFITLKNLSFISRQGAVCNCWKRKIEKNVESEC